MGLRHRSLNGFLADHGVSPAERRIALQVTRGLSNQEIATELGLAVSTVRSALTVVYDKCGTPNRSKFLIFCSPYLVPQEASPTE